MDEIRIADGFPDQIMHVIPKPLLCEAAKNVLVGELYASHIGYFPLTRHHYVSRPKGTEEHILIYCVSGNGWLEIDGKRRKVSAGQALLVPQGCPHSYGASGKHPWEIFWVHFAGEDSAYYSSLLADGEHLLKIDPAISKNVCRLFMEGCKFFDNGFTQSRILCCSQMLRHLLAVIFFGNPAFMPGAAGGRHRSFDNVIEHMRQHLGDGLSLADIARKAGLSVARFSALFRAQTGFSPVQYHIRLRIQAACRLFDTTGLNVSEVAVKVGYPDQYYFSRIFRKVMGMPPRTYRSANRKSLTVDR